MVLFHIWDDKKMDFAALLLEWTILALLIAGIIALPFINWRLSFHLYGNIMLLAAAAGFVFLLLMYWGRMKKTARLQLRGWHFCFLAVFLLLLYNFWLYIPDTVNDVTLETIRTTLATDAIYEYNPLTGKKLQLGIYPISKLNILPLFYSAWASLLPVEPDRLLYIAVPLVGLVLHFLVVYRWGCLLWKEDRNRVGAFLVFYSVVLLFGDYYAASLSYRLLHQGWMSQTILLAVYIPYLGYLCAEMQQQGVRIHKLLSAAVCILSGIFLLPFKSGQPFGEVLRLVVSESSYGKYLGFYLIAVLFLVLVLKKEEKRFLLFFPLIPVTLVIAYAVSVLCLKLTVGKKQWSVSIAAVGLIALAGSVLPFKTDLIKAKYVNQDAVVALEAVEELKETAGEPLVLLAPDEVIRQARAVSGDLYPLYGSDLWNKNINRAVADDYSPEIYQLYELMKEDYLHPDKAADLALQYGCNVLLLREPITAEVGRETKTWEFVKEVPGYLVYQLRDMVE